MQRGFIFSAVDDDIRIFFGGFYVDTMHDFNGVDILIDNAFDISATLGDVSA